MAASRPYLYGRPKALGRPTTFARPHNGFGRPVSVPSGTAPLPTQGKALAATTITSSVSYGPGDANDYDPPGGDTTITASNTEAPAERYWFVAGAASDLTVTWYQNISPDPSNYVRLTLTLRKNGTSTALAGTTVAGVDTPQTISNGPVAVTADDYNIRVDPSGAGVSGIARPRGYWLNFASTVGHSVNWTSRSTGSIAASLTRYMQIASGPSTINTTEAPAQLRLKRAVSFQWGILVASNTKTTSTTFNLRVNGATVDTLTVTATTTGRILSGVTTSIPADALVCVQIVTGSGTGSISLDSACMCTLTNLVTAENDLALYWGFTANSGYAPLAGVGPTSSTYYGNEAYNQVPHRFSGIARALRCYVPTNTRSDSLVLTYRINGANTALSVTIPAGTTGWFESTSALEAEFGPDDLCNYNLTNSAGSGSATIQNVLCTEQYTGE